MSSASSDISGTSVGACGGRLLEQLDEHAMASTTDLIVEAFFWICLTIVWKSLIALRHESVNSGIESEFQLSSSKPREVGAQVGDAVGEQLRLDGRERRDHRQST